MTKHTDSGAESTEKKSEPIQSSTPAPEEGQPTTPVCHVNQPTEPPDPPQFAEGMVTPSNVGRSKRATAETYVPLQPQPSVEATTPKAYLPTWRVADEETDWGKLGKRTAIIVVAILLFLLLFLVGIPTCSRHVRAAIGSAIPAATTVEDETEAEGEAETKPSDASATTDKAEMAKAIDALTVEKVSPEKLEELTTTKYKDVSWVLLRSSLSTHDRSRTEATGFSDALTYGFSAKDDAGRFREIQEEILRNPVYGVTVVNALRDKKIGEKTIESFNPWMKEMADLNEQYGVSYWLETERDEFYVTKEYRIYAATLCTWLERLVSLGTQTRQTTENWCLNPAAKNNDRKGIKADYQYAKEALVFAYVGKNGAGSGAKGSTSSGDGSESLLVIGFNIHDKRPEFYGDPKNPVKTSTVPPTTPTTPTTPKGGNPPKGNTPPDTPPDNPPDDPGYSKDPNKAPTTNTEPNDDSGPGPSTNTGEGSSVSSEDQPTNSTSYESYEEYENDVAELVEINENQSTGSDDSTPSTPAPTSDTTVDNNGDSGTDTSAPINDPTPVTPPATEAETGEPISNSPGEAWEGPAD